MSLGTWKSAWSSSQCSNAPLFHLRLSGTRGAPKRHRGCSIAESHACHGLSDTESSSCSVDGDAGNKPCVTRRCALGGLASGLTLLSMPASAEDRAAGICWPCRLTLPWTLGWNAIMSRHSVSATCGHTHRCYGTGETVRGENIGVRASQWPALHCHGAAQCTHRQRSHIRQCGRL